MKSVLKRKSSILFFFLLIFVIAITIVYYFSLGRQMKIGYAGTLSGLNSDLGVSGRNGAMLAALNINENGGIDGKELVIIPKDDQNNTEQALAVDKEFKSEGINLIIGHMTSQMAESTVPFINENQMLMMSPTIAVDSLSNQDDFFFRVIPSNKTQAKAICDRMILDNVRRVAIIMDKKNLLFTATLRDFFVDYFQAAGGEVVRICEFETTEILCEECIDKVRTNQMDGMFIIAGSESFAIVSQSLFQLGLHTELYGPTWAMTADLLQHGGASVEGAQFPNYFDHSAESPAYVRFREEYLTTYGNEPSFASFLSYEAVMVLTRAIEETGSTVPDVLAEYIKNRSFQGLNGPIMFNEFGDVERAIYGNKVVNGQYQIQN